MLTLQSLETFRRATSAKWIHTTAYAPAAEKVFIYVFMIVFFGNDHLIVIVILIVMSLMITREYTCMYMYVNFVINGNNTNDQKYLNSNVDGDNDIG